MNEPSDLRRELRATVEALESILERERSSGVAQLQIDPEIVDRLGPVRLPSGPPGETPRRVSSDPAADLARLEEEARACTRCPLHRSRRQVVFGAGNPRARLMFVGEAPGRDEDIQGIPFVGRAGRLLTRIIEAMGLTRRDVYIGNILKCRPPENRTPYPDEMATCVPFLQAQIDIIQPEVLVALGAVAVRGLLDVRGGITRLRGNWMTYRGIPLMPTFHPAYLLRNESAKREVWEDMKEVLRRLDLPVPQRTKRGGGS